MEIFLLFDSLWSFDISEVGCSQLMLKQKEIFLPTISSSSLAASSSQIPTRRTDSKTDTDSSSSLPPGTWLNLISEAGLDLDDSSFSTSISQIISLSRALTLPSIFADSNWQTGELKAQKVPGSSSSDPLLPASPSTT